MSLFPQYNHQGDLQVWTPNRISEKRWKKENREAFLPLVSRFCREMEVSMEMLTEYHIQLSANGVVFHLWHSFLRWHNVTTDERGSVHSAKLEPLLFTQLWPGKELPKDFYTIFPPFKFEPK